MSTLKNSEPQIQLQNLITALKLGQIDWLTYLALCRGETPVRKGAA